MNTATFRFYAELNDFLPPEKRQRVVGYKFRGGPAVKDAIEALGVPHTEVDVVLVNGCSVDFAYHLRPGDRVAVYPVFESLDITPLVRLRQQPLRRTAFLTDVHLGKLTRLLRMLGMDTVQSEAVEDTRIVASGGATFIHRLELGVLDSSGRRCLFGRECRDDHAAHRQQHAK